MVHSISAKIFLEVVGSPEGSDIYEIRKILERRVLDSAGERRENFGQWGPSEYAMHIICSFMTKIYWKSLGGNESFSISESLNDTLNLMAYDNWQKRQKFMVEGNARRDWEYSLHSFAQACLNYYNNSSSEKNEAA